MMPPLRDGACEILVFGCGRWFCRDDQVGLLVAQALEQRGLAGVRITTSENPGADLPSCFSGERLLIVIDAAAADDSHPPGTWQRIDAIADRNRILSNRPDSIRAPTLREGSAFTQRAAGHMREPLPSHDAQRHDHDQSLDHRSDVSPPPPRRANTHMIGVNIALDLAAELNVLPETVWVYAIAIDSAGRGDAVTPAVERGASGGTDAITADIQRWQTHREPQHA